MLYLRNMAVADLIMTLTIPVTVIEMTPVRPWWLPVVSCRYTAVLFYCCMYANILFLGLTAVDRYLKIVRPFGGQCWNCLYSYSFTLAMAFTVWLVNVTISLPNTILTNQNVTSENACNCTLLKSGGGKIWNQVVIYINTGIFYLVLTTLLFCNVSIYMHIRRSSGQFVVVDTPSQRQPKKGQNFLVLLVVFFISFVPYHLWRSLFTHSNIVSNDLLMCGKKVTLFLSSCNVCLDPIIYFFMCRSFRIELRQTLRVWPRLENMVKEITTPDCERPMVLLFKENSASV